MSQNIATGAASLKYKRNRIYTKKGPHPNPVLAALGFNCTFDDRFWSKVNRGDGCWLWNAVLDDKGYGMIHKGGAKPQMIHSHRASCIRPDHLHLATHADNMRECSEKKRARGLPGESHNLAKLTDEQVVEIRRRYQWRSREHGIYALGREFGVHAATIHAIVRRETWTHI